MTRRLPILLVALLGLSAAACAPIAGERSLGWRAATAPALQATAARGPDESLRAFLDRARPGESAAVSAPGEAAALVVTLDRDYHAASGKTCRRLSIARGDGAAEPRAACRDGTGLWQLLPQLENRALPSVAGPARVP
jgi:antitoxin (DNA-binding transcriptional repressor) of toxin-antitoxin stability system